VFDPEFDYRPGFAVESAQGDELSRLGVFVVIPVSHWRLTGTEFTAGFIEPAAARGPLYLQHAHQVLDSVPYATTLEWEREDASAARMTTRHTRV
jgi:hypothetical protein